MRPESSACKYAYESADNGKRYMCSAVVKMKSSFPPTGIIVRKDSKSLKVFIAFTGDIYPTTNRKRI